MSLHKELDEIIKLLDNCKLISSTKELTNKNIRIATNFQYFDGSFVDLFIEYEESLFKNQLDTILLSDFGSTLSLLSDMKINPLKNSKRRFFLEETLKQYGVKLEGWDLEYNVNINDFIKGIITLSQACKQIADLAFTKIFSPINTFNDQIEDVIADNFVYEKNKEIKLDEKNLVRFDFLIFSNSINSAILAFSTGNRYQSIIKANAIVRKWRDLIDYDRKEKRITIFDDSYDIYRTKDLTDFGKLSNLIPFSEYDKLPDIIVN